MPTREAIVDSVLPKAVEKPIPTRTVTTRLQRPNINQENIVKSSPAAEVPAKPEESVRLSPQLSALARKEQAFRQKELALSEREKAIEAKLAQADRYSQLEAKFKSKDFSQAEEMGLDYEGYTKWLLDKQAGEDPQSEKYKALEEKIQALEKSQEEKASAEYEETVAEYKREIDQLVETSPDFPKIKKAAKQDAVLQLILDSWEEDSLEMTVDQAAKDVEIYLGEEAKKWASLMEEPKPVVEEQKLPSPKIGSRTLTQQMQPSGIEKVAQKSLQHLSESERYEEARRRVLARRQPEGR